MSCYFLLVLDSKIYLTDRFYVRVGRVGHSNSTPLHGFLLCSMRWEVIVCFIDIGGIVDHQFKLSFHNHISFYAFLMNSSKWYGNSLERIYLIMLLRVKILWKLHKEKWYNFFLTNITNFCAYNIITCCICWFSSQ
jgi:hypothetical protein